MDICEEKYFEQILKKGESCSPDCLTLKVETLKIVLNSLPVVKKNLGSSIRQFLSYVSYCSFGYLLIVMHVIV